MGLEVEAPRSPLNYFSSYISYSLLEYKLVERCFATYFLETELH